MKITDTGGDMNGSYINDALKCSTLEISGGKDDIEASKEGSNEYILKVDDEPQQTCMQSSLEWTKQKARSIFTKKTLYKRVPILRWLPTYSKADGIGDLVAGITVGLTVIPQALAYAGIAGLPAAYGLYGSFMGCFVYILLGSCKDVPMGPTAISALLTFQTAHGSAVKAVLLTFLTGCIELLMGFCGLGFLIDFVSGPVSSGFTSAVALIICTSQVKDVLAIHAAGSTFVQTWISIFENIHLSQPWDAALGVTCIAALLVLKTLGTIRIGPDSDELRTRGERLFNTALWFIGTARNAILVIVCGALGYAFVSSGGGELTDAPFQLIGEIPPGMPALQVPTFSTDDESFGDMIASMGSGLIVVPLIALMENIAICKAFANGKPVDATQELIAIGAGNVANSFVQGFPGTGSLSRGAVNNASGARTPMGSLYTGVLVVCALLFMTPLFAFIPKASLAAIIMAAVIFMVEVKVLKPMWRSKKTDLIPGLGAFIACLVLPLEIGILTGIAINMVFILYHTARPKIAIERLTSPHGIDYLMITPDRCLIFPSVDYVRNLIMKQARRQPIPVVVDCSHVYGTDFTAANVVESVSKEFAARDQPLFFFNLKPSLCTVFEALVPADFTVYYREEQIDELLQDRGYKPTVGEKPTTMTV